MGGGSSRACSRPDLFSFAIAITFIGPGPRTGFIAGVGYYLAGLPGAIVALSGLVLPTVLGSAGVSVGLDTMEKLVKAVAPSSGFVIAALVAAGHGESRHRSDCDRRRSPPLRSWQGSSSGATPTPSGWCLPPST